MPWSAGTFSRANGATGWQDDQAANIGIEAGRHDTQDNDFRNGINETINKAGQNTPTANLPMGGFKHTGVANAAASAEYAAYGQVQAGVNVQSTALDWTATQYSNDTTAAKFVLQKSRGATTGSNVIVNNGDSIGSLEFRGNNGTTFTNAASIAAAVDGAPGATNDMPGRLVFSTSADASGTPTERMRIDSTGKVGIGASPAYDLDLDKTVNGDVTLHIYNRSNGANARDAILFGNDQNAANASITLNGNNYSGSGIGDANDLVLTNASTTGAIRFATAPSGGGAPVLRVNIDNNGAVGFNNGSIIITSSAISAGAGTHFIKWNSTTGVLTYDTSSGRYKTNVTPLQYGLATVLQMQPKQFNYITDGRPDVGFIAEDMIAVVPEIVAMNLNNEPDTISYDRLVAVLCKAIQELEARVAALEGA